MKRSLFGVLGLLLAVVASSPLLARTLDTLADAPVVQVTQSRSEILKFKAPISRVSVADPNILDVIPLDPEQFILNGKARGATSVLLWDNTGQEGQILVRVNAANEELLDIVREINREPKTQVQTLITDDSVVFSGKADSTSQVDKLIRAAKAFGYKDENIIDLTEASSMQVSLKVKVTEASREVVRNLQASVQYLTPQLAVTKLGNNIDVQRLLAALTGSVAAASAQQPTGNNLTAGIIPNVVGRRVAPLAQTLGSTNVGGLTTSYLPSWNKNLQFALDFLETNGRLKTLAEPTLVVAHGQEANFLAGGEIPFVSGTDRNGGPILSFKEYGVKLRFRPRIMSDGSRIVMEVEPEVSTLDRSNCVQSNGQPVCGLLKRSTKTLVELENNQTLFLSGIISQEEQDFVQKVPYLADVPIIGPLFRNKNTRKNERELLIVITPSVLKKSI